MSEPVYSRLSPQIFVLTGVMKVARFVHEGKRGFGIVKGGEIAVAEGDMFGEFHATTQVYSLTDVRLRAPTLPSKVVALGLNYRDHAEELNMRVPEEPLIFLKPASAVIGHLDAILYPAVSKRVDYEGELAIVIGKTASKISEAESDKFILGYTCFNDVTARDLQRKDGQWTRSKSFDTFAPMGPWIETELDPCKLKVETFVNGNCKQSSDTSNLVFTPRQLGSFISHVMTLYPGDVIATGTPPGVGPLQVGDTVEVVIEDIGTLANSVVGE